MLEKIKRYAQTHKKDCIHTLEQFLRNFDKDSPLLAAIQEMLLQEQEEQRKAAEARSRRATFVDVYDDGSMKPPKKEQIIEPTKPQTPVGKCPKCTSMMFGEPVKKCEEKKSGRVFYKECGACTYYVEIFKRKNKHIEVEGE